MTVSKIIKNANTKSVGGGTQSYPKIMKKTPEIMFSDRDKISIQSAAPDFVYKKVRALCLGSINQHFGLYSIIFP